MSTIEASESTITATAALFQHTKEIEELEKSIVISKRKMEFEKTKRFETRLIDLKSQVDQVA